MWFEILPAAAIIGMAIGFPTIGIVILNKLAFGNIYKKDLTLPWDRRYFLRDSRLSEDPYKQLGLETIEDDDNKPEKTGGKNNPPPLKIKDVCMKSFKNSQPTTPAQKDSEEELELKKDVIPGSAGQIGPSKTENIPEQSDGWKNILSKKSIELDEPIQEIETTSISDKHEPGVENENSARNKDNENENSARNKDNENDVSA